MRRIALALMLAGCAAVPSGDGYRDRSVPIASTTRGGVADLAGDWVIAQSFGNFGRAGHGLRIAPTEGGADWLVPVPGGTTRLRMQAGQPGRYLAANGTEIWLLWADDAFRTAAVGTPDGSFGWIMNRQNAASADRTTAARDVLAFFGYDIDRLSGGATQ